MYLYFCNESNKEQGDDTFLKILFKKIEIQIFKSILKISMRLNFPCFTNKDRKKEKTNIVCEWIKDWKRDLPLIAAH